MKKVVKNEQAKDFTIISNSILKNKKLNLNSIGVLCTILSLPDDWCYSLRGLAAISDDGVYKTNTALKALEEAGYITRQLVSNSKGQIIRTNFIVNETSKDTQGYTVVPNNHLRNKNLSWSAKGLLSIIHMLSCDVRITIRSLATMVKNGVDSVARAMKELEEAGYIIITRHRNKRGQLGESEYTVYHTPHKKPSENHISTEIKTTNNLENKNIAKYSHITQKSVHGKEGIQFSVHGNTTGVQKSVYGEKTPVQKPVYGEKPYLDNCTQSNTIINSTNSSISVYQSTVEYSENEKNGQTDMTDWKKACDNTLAVDDIKKLIEQMSFVPKAERLDYFRSLYVRMQKQQSKSNHIRNILAYIAKMIDNDRTMCYVMQSKPQYKHYDPKLENSYGAAYDLAAYENADPFADENSAA